MVQSHIFPVTDTLLKVVANKALLVKVNVTNAVSQAVPDATLNVLDDQGALQLTVALTKPASLPTSMPNRPDFALAYTALVPANLVKPGMALSVAISGGAAATVVKPVVQLAPAIKIVGVPVRHSDGGDATPLPVSVASQLLDRYPVSGVTYTVRSTPINLGKPNAEVNNPDNRDVFKEAMNAVGEARSTDLKDQPDTFYYGFVYWAAYGGVGVGTLGGRMAAGWDRHGDPALAEGVRDTWIHETGHNFGLGHAPTESEPASAEYPYAGGLMGNSSRAIWTYLMSEGTAQTLRDPLQTRDVMSYSGPSYGRFSDHNYMLAFEALRASILKSAPASKTSAAPSEMLLLSGELAANGTVRWRPARQYLGTYNAPSTASHSLRVTYANGSVRSYPVALERYSDGSGGQVFMQGVPYSAGAAQIELLSANGRQIATLGDASGTRSAQAKDAPPQLQERESGGRLAVTWNAARYRYLTISHVSGTERTTLAVNHEGGRTEMDVRTLPAGGAYEFALSDGLNSLRLTRPR